MDGKQILDLPMRENDAGAETVRDYLKALVSALIEEGESFSGKRPFGNSGWEWDIPCALVHGGAIEGIVDEDGNLQKHDEVAAAKAIAEAIAAL